MRLTISCLYMMPALLGLDLSYFQIYFMPSMWIILAVSLIGSILCYLRSDNLKLWYTLSLLLCISSFCIVLNTGSLDSKYFLLLYLALLITSLKGKIWPCLVFCAVSSFTTYFVSGKGLSIFDDIGSLTELTLLPFFTVVAFFINAAINKPISEMEKRKDERVEEAYAIARHQVAQKEESEIQFFDRQRKLYSLLQLFQKLSSERSAKVVEDGVVYFAREEVKSQVSFVAFNEDGKWRTPNFLGISEVMARTISQKIEAGIFSKVISTGEIINYKNVQYHTQGIGATEKKPFDSNSMSLRNILVVPLQDASGHKPFGVLAVANKLMGDQYDKNDIDYLKLLATEAAITLSNMKLYSKLERSYYETILALAQAIEAKDPYTHGHVSRVEQLSVFICKCIGLDQESTELIAKAAILHDVGKISIPDHILMKPDALTDEEFEIMKTHTSNARNILNNITSLPAQVIDMVVHHHERYDGKGYPDGLQGRAIPLGSQIIAIADSFDAMITDRPYRKGLSIEEALSRLERGNGTQFSPYMVEKFLQNIEKVDDLDSLPHYFDC
ncbi:MAG: GAF and HD-GYP domain-containing protein [Candidatus Bruticola sp.]